jgi:molybdopterin converting factor small subunit
MVLHQDYGPMIWKSMKSFRNIGGACMKKLKVVELKYGHVTQQLALEEVERKVAEAQREGYLVLVDGELLQKLDQTRRILEAANEVFIVPPVAGG